jgi:hypothetical protein
VKRADILLVFVLLYGAASFFHHAHNAHYLRDYPNLPPWLSAAGVYGAWVGTTALGVLGYLLLRHGSERSGVFTLAIYAGLGFYGLAHYWIAPMWAHTLAMNLTIWLEVTTAAMLLIALAVLATRPRSP